MVRRAFHARVRGVVQGVAFRYSTRREALRLGLDGWVRNLPDGSVELRAAGREEALRELAAWLERGPPAARVTDLDVRWIEPDEAPAGVGFHIRG